MIPTAERPYEIRTETVVGSDPALADLVLTDPSVAPRHAALVPDADDDTWIVRDLGGWHDTFVDGQRVDGQRRLVDRHELQLGRARLAFVIEPAARVVVADVPRIERRHGSVPLEAVDVEILRVLATARTAAATCRVPTGRGFVRSDALGHLVPYSPHLATATVRQLVRRLERKLAALGEPPLLEFCERRGYRVRASVAFVDPIAR